MPVVTKQVVTMDSVGYIEKPLLFIKVHQDRVVLEVSGAVSAGAGSARPGMCTGLRAQPGISEAYASDS